MFFIMIRRWPDQREESRPSEERPGLPFAEPVAKPAVGKTHLGTRMCLSAEAELLRRHLLQHLGKKLCLLLLIDLAKTE
jgi:hypothetical protein